jgi:hypothetical protein
MDRGESVFDLLDAHGWKPSAKSTTRLAFVQLHGECPLRLFDLDRIDDNV